MHDCPPSSDTRSSLLASKTLNAVTPKDLAGIPDSDSGLAHRMLLLPSTQQMFVERVFGDVPAPAEILLICEGRGLVEGVDSKLWILEHFKKIKHADKFECLDSKLGGVEKLQ